MTTCEECGFVYDLGTPEVFAGQVRTAAEAYVEPLLTTPGEALRRRPAPETWSPLEYACHVRDVLLVQRERVLLARRTETPVAEPMGRDERVEHDGYAEQDPADVARQLLDAARLFAHTLDRLGPGDWDRTLVYTYPERAECLLRWLAAHTLHEVRHHFQDLARQLPAGEPVRG
ncbi:DinB family protein [Streptomyces sp. NRRL F-5123]|uniref:DinB family protein n=1 Tax=Streptomyces sp. NRRL F-5123 TaxID=1463856 RepID=UPI0005BC8301|nr:DinB family protein [Streptomyces sp. NRRL F-5123]